MPSMSKTLLFIAATFASTIIATPIQARQGNPMASCWASGNKGTDANQPTVGNCAGADNTLIGYSAGYEYWNHTSTTQLVTYISVGPWHCCSTCTANAQCVGWQINDDCTCQTWIQEVAGACPAPVGVYGHTNDGVTNTSSTFHPASCFGSA